MSATTLPPDSKTTLTAPPAARTRWVAVGVAAMAMVATLPGRTHGLGLITEPLLEYFKLSHLDYGRINTWATLLGATFCLPCGWLLDRVGRRPVLTAVTLALGATVLAMTRIESVPVLAV